MRFLHNPFTDQLDISGLGPGGTTTEFLTGNDGVPVPSDAGFNIFVLGENATGINTTGNAGTSTLTIHGLASTTVQVGTTRYATNAEAAAQSIGTAALTPANITSLFSTNPLPSSQGGTGLSSPAAHSLIVSNGSSPFTVLGVAANGQLPIGSVGGNPVLNTLTAGTGISISNGPGTITISSSATVFTYTNVTHAQSPYTVLNTDLYLSVDTSGGTVVLDFPNTTTTGTRFIVKDRTGTSATNNITITTPGGVVTFDGSPSYMINTNFYSLELLFNGSNYEVF